MPSRFTTGEFAAMTGLSIEALRLYDERGVLRPATVDPSTGHRSYASAQLRRAQVLGFLRQTSLGLDDLRADPADVTALRERVAHARRLEDFTLEVAERLQNSTPELLEPTTRTMPETSWVGLVRTIELPDAREDANDALGGQVATFDDAAAELAAACPPPPSEEDLWWTTTWSSPDARSLAVLVARPGVPPAPAGYALNPRGTPTSLVTGSLPHREEISFPVLGGSAATDPVGEASAGFLEILAFDAYLSARSLDDRPVVTRRVTYGPTHLLAQPPDRPTTVFDVALA